MLAGCFLFAVMGILAHAAGQRCEWQIVALARSILVAVFVGSAALASGTKLVFWKPRILWMRSIAGSISLLGTFYALTHFQVSTVLTLTNTFPIWVALLSWPMLGELPSARVWLAVLSGVVGVWFIQQPHGDGPPTAFFVALLSALMTAVAMLGLHRLQGLDPRAIVVHFACLATVVCVASLFIFPMSPGTMAFYQPEPLLLLLGVGITASIGQLLLTKAFAAGDPAKVSVVGLTQVVFAFLFELFQNNPVRLPTLIGMGLIIAPIAWIMRRR
jgi:drug/metabolite transporter (DMT)-like permease